MFAIADVASRRAKMWDAGFRPVPVYQPDPPREDGKRPWGDKWQIAALRDPPLAVVEVPRAYALNTGLLCGVLRGIDSDVDDPRIGGRIKAAFFDTVGETLIRCRANSPRAVLLCRAAEGTPGGRTIRGEHGAVQILGRGQQFVADGLHYTGATIDWWPRPPWEERFENIPVMTPAQEAILVREIGAIIGAPDISHIREAREGVDSQPRDGLERRQGTPWRVYANYQTFAVQALREIPTLILGRPYPGGIVPEGMRDRFAFTIAALVAIAYPASEVFDRTLAFTAAIMPPDFHSDKLPGYIGSAVRRREAAAEGIEVYYGGRWQTAAYLVSREWVVAMLEVTRAEQAGFHALISEAERKARGRRAQGIPERAIYKAAVAAPSDERRIQAVVMHGQGMSLRAIGAALGVSHIRVRQYLQGC